MSGSTSGLALPGPAGATIKLYPSLALAMLRAEQAAAGRLWLLLRHLDQAGRGWVEVDAVHSCLCQPDSPLRLCGRRQLQNLLRQGEGLFWQQRAGRLWLHSTLKVAADLGLTRLSGRPVALPVAVLLQGLGVVRAHFFASFHSGRGQSQARPISRAALEAICRVKPRTQRHYDRLAGVGRQANFARGGRDTPEERQTQAWRRGRAVFLFHAARGDARNAGLAYVAWQLPNSYQGPHRQLPKGRQKRWNHQLADLFTQGMTGNGEPRGSRRLGLLGWPSHHRFFNSGQLAAKAYGRCPSADLYWPGRRARAGRWWRYLPAQETG